MVQHAIEWITWHAAHDSEEVTAETKRAYDADVHQAFPLLLGAVAAMASLSDAAYAVMRPILEEPCTLDERVGMAMRGIGSEHSRAISDLAELYFEANAFYPRLTETFAAALAAAGTTTQRLSRHAIKPELLAR